MAIERLRSLASSIIGRSISETTQPVEVKRCIVYQAPDGRHSFSSYETDLDSEKISQALTEGGNAILGSYTVQEARDLLDRINVNVIEHINNISII